MDEDRTAAQTSDRLNARDYKVDYMDNDRPHLLLDVRSRPETEICKLPNSRNIPIDDIDKNLERIRSEVSILPPVKNKKRVVVCCRRGNDSKSAVIKLRAHFKVCSLHIFTIFQVTHTLWWCGKRATWPSFRTLFSLRSTLWPCVDPLLLLGSICNLEREKIGYKIGIDPRSSLRSSLRETIFIGTDNFHYPILRMG